MFTLQIVGNAYVPLTVWSDLKQFTSEKAWRRISVGGLVAEWYGGGERKWGSDCCVRLWYCKPCCGTPGYWLCYVNTHWFSCVCHFGRVTIYFPRGWGLFPRAPLHSTPPPPPPGIHTHARTYRGNKQTNKHTSLWTQVQIQIRVLIISELIHTWTLPYAALYPFASLCFSPLLFLVAAYHPSSQLPLSSYRCTAILPHLYLLIHSPSFFPPPDCGLSAL